MEKVEEKAKKISRRANLQQALALTLYGTAGISLALLAPNAMRLLRRIDPDLKKKRNPAYRLQQAFKRLQDRGIVARKKYPKGTTVFLTEKGRGYAEKLHAMEKIHISVPLKWDGRWRIVIFDVWERRRGVRDKLRRALVKAGFVRMQNSVWIYPYDCEEFLAFLRAELRLGPSILYIIADGVEGDAKYRFHFNLP